MKQNHFNLVTFSFRVHLDIGPSIYKLNGSNI